MARAKPKSRSMSTSTGLRHLWWSAVGEDVGKAAGKADTKVATGGEAAMEAGSKEARAASSVAKKDIATTGAKPEVTLTDTETATNAGRKEAAGKAYNKDSALTDAEQAKAFETGRLEKAGASQAEKEMAEMIAREEAAKPFLTKAYKALVNNIGMIAGAALTFVML